MNAKVLTMWKNISPDNILFVLIDFQEKFFPILKKSVVKLVKANIYLVKLLKEHQASLSYVGKTIDNKR
jgi:hypothetical protein